MLNSPGRILKNAFWLSTANIFSKVAAVFSAIYVARVLEPDAFGQLNFALAIVSYFAMTSAMGLDVLGCREIARNREAAGDFIARVLMLRLLLGVCAFTLLALAAFLVPHLSQVRVLVLLFGLSFFPSALKLDWAFRGVERMRTIAVLEICGQLLYAGLILLLVKGAVDLVKVPLIQVVAGMIPAGALFYSARRNFGKISLKGDLSSWRCLLRESYPIGLSGLMFAVLFHLDTTMLGFLKTAAEVGQYSAAYKIVWCLSGFFFAYFDSVLPTYSSCYKVSLDAVKEIVEYSGRLMSTILLPLATGGTVLAAPIMSLLYGGKYDGAVPVLQILLWSMVGMCLGAVFSVALLGCDLQAAYFKIACGRAVAVVVLNSILIPAWGTIGASLATMISEVMGVPVYQRALNGIVRVRVAVYMYRPAVASVCMGLFLIALQPYEVNVIFRIAGGMLVYLVTLYGIGGVTREEIVTMKRLLLTPKWVGE